MVSKEKCEKKSCLGGYLTLEASMMIPFIIVLYMIFIYLALFLYDKCLLDQDYYLLSFRGSVLSNTRDAYGEVIYGNLKSRSTKQIEADIANLRNGLVGKYPKLVKGQDTIIINDNSITILGSGVMGGFYERTFHITVLKKAQIINPITIIRNLRKE